jgi:hypothetical protein
MRNQYSRNTAAPPAQRAQITIAAMATGGREADSRLLGMMGIKVATLVVRVEKTRVVDLVEVDLRIVEEDETTETEAVVLGREVG